MKKLNILLVLCLASIVFAADGDRFSTGDNDEFRINGSGNVIMTGDITQTGDFTQDGDWVQSARTRVYLGTGTALTLNDNVILICGTGTLTSQVIPFITTTTASGVQYTRFLIIGGTNTFTLQDNGTLSGSRLNLGATTRALGDGDTLELILSGAEWREISFTNNQ